MRYFRHNEEEFLANGHSQIRVATVTHFKRPASPGRIIKVFTVLGQVRESPANPVNRGALLCLSFPEMEVNSRDYVWGKNGPEETQVKMNVQLHKTKGPLLHDTASPVDAPVVKVKD